LSHLDELEILMSTTLRRVGHPLQSTDSSYCRCYCPYRRSGLLMIPTTYNR